MVKIKKKLVVNTGILTILFVFCIGPMIASSLDSSISTIPEQPTSLHTSTTFWASSIDLDNGFWLARNIGDLSSGNYFYYEYDTNPYALLDVYLLDSSNYALYAASQSYTAYSILELNEDYVWSEGPVYVYKSDTFWVVFENTYSDTSLDYSISTYATVPFPNIFGQLMTTFIVIIVVSVVIGIVVIAVIVYAIRKNKSTIKTTPYRSSTQKTPTPSTPVYQQPAASSSSKSEQAKGTIGFCRYCGEKTEIDAAFCPKCGSKL